MVTRADTRQLTEFSRKVTPMWLTASMSYSFDLSRIRLSREALQRNMARLHHTHDQAFGRTCEQAVDDVLDHLRGDALTVGR
jgi:hypothetical protein